MAFCGVGQAKMTPAQGTKSVEPIAGSIYADHVCCWSHATLSFLYFAVPQTGLRQLFGAVKGGGINLAYACSHATRCSTPYPTPSRRLAGPRDGSVDRGPLDGALIRWTCPLFDG